MPALAKEALKASTNVQQCPQTAVHLLLWTSDYIAKCSHVIAFLEVTHQYKTRFSMVFILKALTRRLHVHFECDSRALCPEWDICFSPYPQGSDVFKDEGQKNGKSHMC